MSDNKVIYQEEIRGTSDKFSKTLVRIVSTDPSRSRNPNLYYEIYEGKDSLGNPIWKSACTGLQEAILKHLGLEYIKICQKEKFGDNKCQEEKISV